MCQLISGQDTSPLNSPFKTPKTMIAELEHPIESIRGNLTKEHDARVQYGKVVIQRRPKRDKPPTEAQKRAREAFAKKYAGKH